MKQVPSPTEQARTIVERFVRESGCEEGIEALYGAIAEALGSSVESERQRIAAFCEDRAEMWSRSGHHAEQPERARTEGRARANEARFLADAVRAGLGETGPGEGSDWVF